MTRVKLHAGDRPPADSNAATGGRRSPPYRNRREQVIESKCESTSCAEAAPEPDELFVT